MFSWLKFGARVASDSGEKFKFKPRAVTMFYRLYLLIAIVSLIFFKPISHIVGLYWQKKKLAKYVEHLPSPKHYPLVGVGNRFFWKNNEGNVQKRTNRIDESKSCHVNGLTSFKSWSSKKQKWCTKCAQLKETCSMQRIFPNHNWVICHECAGNNVWIMFAIYRRLRFVICRIKDIETQEDSE